MVFVLGQYVVYPRAGSRQASHFFAFAFLVAIALWLSTSIWMIHLRCLLPGDQDERRQIEISRIQQLQHPLDGFYHCQCDNRVGWLPVRVYLGFVSPAITHPARAADPVVVTILGGVGTLYGPLLGRSLTPV